MSRQRLAELKGLLEQHRPKGTNKKDWARHMESLKRQIYLLENNLEQKEKNNSSKNFGTSFWKVSEKVEMRHTLGTAWGVNKTGISNWVTRSPDKK